MVGIYIFPFYRVKKKNGTHQYSLENRKAFWSLEHINYINMNSGTHKLALEHVNELWNTYMKPGTHK